MYYVTEDYRLQFSTPHVEMAVERNG